MSGTSKLARQITVITHSIFAEFFITDVTKSGVIINQFIIHGHYHLFAEFKLIINFFDILLKCVYKYLRNIVIVKFYYKSNWLLRMESIVNTLYVVKKSAGREGLKYIYIFYKNKWLLRMVTKSAGDVFLILLGVVLVRVWLACWQQWREGLKKISIYNKWDWHWPIVIFKRYFRSLFVKFNCYSFVWLTIPIMRC